jgi:predicted DsbA family dithiol-disulfide isomerase
MAAEPPLAVEVWADVACPWCWMGHARLRAALADEPPGSVEVRPRAFELQPGLPPEGMAVEDFYPRKFGSAEAMREAFVRTATEAQRSGLAIRFDRMKRAPNTRLAHRAIALAARTGHALGALDALFTAHFRDGEDIADADVVVARAAGAAPGLEPRALRAALQAGEGEAEVAADEAEAARLGVTGVPFFLAGGVVAVSGAHEPDLMRKLVAAARQRLAAA